MLTGNGKLDAWDEAKYWHREVEGIVGWTREEATRLGIAVPENFAHDERWWAAEAEIEKAIGEGDYIKTRDLCRAYTTRAVRYCQTWLENKKAQLAKTEAIGI